MAENRMITGGSRGLEESKCQCYPQDGQGEGDSRDLEAGQPHLKPWEKVVEQLIVKTTAF